MKPWNVSEIQPNYRKYPRLKGLARRLRDWLDDFLVETGDNRVGQGRIPGPTAELGEISSEASARDQRDLGPAVRDGEQEEVSPWNALHPPGPPEDWLRRVREGAPELLRAVEPGGTHSSTAHEPAIGSQDMQRETLAPTSSLRSGEASAAVPGKRTIEGALPSSTTPATAARTNSWFQLLRRWSRTSEVTKREEKIDLQPHRDSSGPSPRRREPLVVGTPIMPEHASLTPPQLRRQLQSDAIQSEPPTMEKISAEESSFSGWRERIRQGTQARWPFIGRKNNGEGPVFRKTGKANSMEATAESSSAAMDHVSSRPPATFLNADQPSGRGVSSPVGQRSREQAKSAPGWWPNSQTRPPLGSSIRQPRNQAWESVMADPIPTSRRQNEPLATQPADPWALDSARWPEPERGDLWPALPEDPPSASMDSVQFLRSAERLQTLDREQRGGR